MCHENFVVIAENGRTEGFGHGWHFLFHSLSIKKRNMGWQKGSKGFLSPSPHIHVHVYLTMMESGPSIFHVCVDRQLCALLHKPIL